jgi:putative alpha-1,2-mannosidase
MIKEMKIQYQTIRRSVGHVVLAFLFCNLFFTSATFAQSKEPVDYVSTLVGTLSKYELSTGNTYPAIALPWGMNFWTPHGENGKRLDLHVYCR